MYSTHPLLREGFSDPIWAYPCLSARNNDHPLLVPPMKRQQCLGEFYGMGHDRSVGNFMDMSTPVGSEASSEFIVLLRHAQTPEV